MNVAELILSTGNPNDPAVIQAGSTVTYGELCRQVMQWAGALSARGYGKGVRVGIYAENSPIFVAAYFGIIRAGLVAVPFQTDIMPGTLAKISADSGLEAIVASKKFLNLLRPLAESLGVTLFSEADVRDAAAPAPGQMPKIDPARDLAALMFTSGSTGTPKGVMVSHRNIECNSCDIVSYLGLGQEDRCMVVLPFHYCFGMSLLHTHLMAGGSVVLNNYFRLYPETMLKEMAQWECTGLAGVPSTYQILLRNSRIRELAFPKLRWFQQAGGKLPNPVITEIRAAFPQVKYFLMYGQTEATARLSFLPPEKLGDKLGSIGKGLPSTRLEVLKPDGTPVQPGSGEIGEIVATGANITLGYWNDPVETAKYFREGRLHTGDIARVDRDGFIFIVERERELIKSGGNRVSAKEVEETIAELPEIIEVAVVGTPHELLGEAITAFAVTTTETGLTPNRVTEHCRKRLPAFKTPERVILLRSMPHNISGKILKQQLKNWIEPRSPPS
jgi:long-chain acyl-CoA synthetase